MNYDVLNDYKGKIQRPDCWSKYTEPINNLLYAVLLQAALDSNGYYNGFKQCDGSDARQYLETEGARVFKYLEKQERF